VNVALWQYCRNLLEKMISSKEFNTWIRPLQAVEQPGKLVLLAPNPYVLQQVKQHFLEKIEKILDSRKNTAKLQVLLQVGSLKKNPNMQPVAEDVSADAPLVALAGQDEAHSGFGRLNPLFTFDTFITGQSNQLAHAASLQMARRHDFNPLYIYGGVGLGKTHLMQAVGNLVLAEQPHAKVAYVHAEQFVAGLISALHTKRMQEFKQSCRSVDVLLFDDVQFLAGKKRSEEEFLHTLNTLMDRNQRVVVTANCMPSQAGMGESVTSRLGSGLSVVVNKPVLETRVDILLAKAHQNRLQLSDEVAQFIAEHIDYSVRELEGALNRLKAMANLLKQKITLDFSREALADLLSVRQAMPPLTIADIQRAVAEYYALSVEELCSKRRLRHLVRPRQMAISLSKELTTHSLPAIGKAFGGRDRTTVLHSCKTIAELKNCDETVLQDYSHLRDALGGAQ